VASTVAYCADEAAQTRIRDSIIIYVGSRRCGFRRRELVIQIYSLASGLIMHCSCVRLYQPQGRWSCVRRKGIRGRRRVFVTSDAIVNLPGLRRAVPFQIRFCHPGRAGLTSHFTTASPFVNTRMSHSLHELFAGKHAQHMSQPSLANTAVFPQGCDIQDSLSRVHFLSFPVFHSPPRHHARR